jgi:hypothetical protein
MFKGHSAGAAGNFTITGGLIPNRRNAIKQAYCPKRFYRQRHKIENFFCRIKDWRRMVKY